MKTYVSEWDQSEELPMKVYRCMLDGAYHHTEDYEEDAIEWVNS